MSHSRKTEITWTSDTLDGVEREYVVKGTCCPGEPDVWYLPNGDPGYPGSPPEVEDVELWFNGKKVPESEWERHGFTDSEIESLESRLFKQAAKDGQDAEADAADHKRKSRLEERGWGS